MDRQYNAIEDKSGISVLNDIRAIHKNYSLVGTPGNSILNISDDLLLYVISLLRNKAVRCPDVTITQWNELLAALGPHLILPLLYWQIMHLPEESRPPKEVMDQLRVDFLKKSAFSINRKAQIKEILTALKKENIRVLALKGSALAYTVYPDPALRPGSDIDLFVLPDDVRKTRAVMENIGYRCNEKYYDKHKTYFNEEIFEREGNIVVEIHWDLTPYPIFRVVKPGHYFDRAVIIKTKDNTFEALSPIDNIIHIAIHLGYKHSDNIRLNWLYDLFLLCKELTNEDWELLQKRSIEYNVRLVLEDSLIMARYWTGLKIPSQYDDFSKWPKPTETEALAYETIRGRSVFKKAFRLWITKSLSISDNVKLIFYKVFPPAAEMHRQYDFTSNRLLPIYYLKRLCRMFYK